MIFKKNGLYYISFTDHTAGDKRTLAKTETVGWCIQDETEFVVFTYWRIIDDDLEFVKNNYETFTIAKCNIKKKKKLM